MITNHIDFYKKWMENPKHSDRIKLVLQCLDHYNARHILRIDKDGNKSTSVENTMPEIIKIVSLIKENHTVLTGDINMEEVVKQYTNWYRERSLEKLL